MTILIGGHETGLLDSSFTLLNRNDRTRIGTLGQGEQTFVNVSNGNLLIQQRDAFLPSQGEDFALVRTYNARGVASDAQAHEDARWEFSTLVRVDARNDGGSLYFEVKYGDGSIYEFRFDAASGRYVSVDGTGAFETLVVLAPAQDHEPAYVVTRANQTQLTFSKLGQLLSAVDTNGVRMDYTYEADRLVRVNDDQGHVINYVYENGVLVRVTDETSGVLVEYRYSNGRLVEVIDRFGHSTQYFYTTNGFINRILLPTQQTVNGQLETYAARELLIEYEEINWRGDNQARAMVVKRLTDAEGGITTFEYNFEFTTPGATQGKGHLKRPAADGTTASTDKFFLGGTTRVVDALGHRRAYSNDPEYRAWRLTNGYYDLYDATAEANAAFKAQVDAIRAAHSLTYSYRADGFITEVIDPQGLKTTYTYDAQENLTAVTDRNGHAAVTSDSAYFRKLRAELGYVDAAGQGKLVAELTEADKQAILGRFTTRFTYDDRGNLLSRTDGEGHSTTFTYTSFNKLASETSAVGNALVSSDDPVSQQKRVELGFAALVAGLTAADRQALLDLHTTRYTYDARQNLIERRDAGGDITRFEYDTFGNLTRRIVYLDPSDLADPTKQQVTRYAYDAFGNNIETTDGEGHVTRSQYDHFGNLTRFTDARGGITTYTYDADHRLLSVTDPEGHVTVNRYDAVGNRIAVTDANGHSVIHLYDRNNLLIATLDNADTNPAQNRDTRFVYDIVGNRTSVTDAEGRTTTYTYNARRELVEVRTATVADEAGVLRQFLTTYAYDGEGNRIHTTNNRGFTTEVLYTPEGLVRQQTDPTGHVTRFVYDANHNQVTIIAGFQLPEARRQVLRFSYDEEDQLISQTDAQGHTTRYRYDAPGNRAAVTDANGNTTDFEYDKNNRLVKEIRPAVIDPRTGVSTRYTALHQYDANGNEIATTDENGHTTRFTFDKDDRLAMVEDANGLKTVYAYDSRHNRTRVSIGVQAHVDLNGHIVIDSVENAQVTSFVYDEFNQLIAKTDGVAHALTTSDSALYRAMRKSLGVVDPLTGEGKSAAQLTEADTQTLQNAFTERYTYDRVGNYLSTTDHLGRTTSFKYDALNRQIERTDALGQKTAFRYDGNGNRTSQTDALGRTTAFTYDANDRLIDTTDPLGVSTRRAYDAFGNLIEQTRAAGTPEARLTRYEYDLNNRLIRQTDPENHGEAYRYDAVGNRLEVTDGRGNTTQYVYDALNRNVKIIDPLLFETKFEYDGVGNRLAIIDARGGLTRFNYDPGNRRIETTDAEGRTTRFDYDVRGNRIRQTTAFGTPEAETTIYEYDAENNLRAVVDAEGNRTTHDYDRVYNRIGTTDGNGNTTRYAFDALNRNIEIRDAEGGVTRYTYDAVGNRLTQTDALGRVTTFTYDANDRLIVQTAADGVETRFAYDAVGNRVAIMRAANTPQAATTTFAYNKDDQLIAQTDALGNTTTYAYDANHNRTVVTDPNGHATTYVYDANNRVTRIIDPLGNATEYRYDGNGNRIQVIDARGSTSTTYYNANNEVVLSVDAEGGATSFVYDNNGNVVRQTLHAVRLALPLDPASRPTLPVDPRDQVTRFEYDRLNRLTARIDAEGFRTEFRYDAVGNRLETRLFLDLAGTRIAATRSYYDRVNREIATVSAEGYLTIFRYDAVGNRIVRVVHDRRVTIPSDGTPPIPVAGDGGRLTTFAYDAVNRLVQETSALGISAEHVYDARGNRVALIEAAGTPAARRTEYRYDAADRLTEVINALGIVTRMEYDADGNVIARYDAYGTPAQRQTTFVYDGNHRVIEERNALGVITRNVYDAVGNLVTKTSAVGLPEGRSETFEYDRNNRLVAQTNGEGERTTHAYDAAGNRIRTTQAPGLAEERSNFFEYDRDNRLVAAIDGMGVRTAYRYDGAGNKLETIQAAGLAGQERHSFYQYDLDNRLVRITDPMGGVTRYEYDVLGNQTVIINANGGVQQNNFDAAGRLVSSLSAGGVRTVNSYDARGNIIATTQSFADGSDARTTTYLYDALDRQVRVTDPEGFSTSIVYDAFGNQVHVAHGQYLIGPTDPAHDADKAARAFVVTNEFSYDAADRMVRYVDGEGNVTEYRHDAVGNRLQVTEAANSAPRATHHVYDRANRLIETRTPEGGITRNTYDDVGNRVEERLLQSVDAMGVETWIIKRFEFDKNGRMTAEIDPFGVRTERSYDAMGNLIAQRFAAGTADERVVRTEWDLNNRKAANIDGEGNRTVYAYDAMGNRTKVTDALGRVARYYFNGANRLIAVLDPEGYVNTFQYDSAGNQTEVRLYMTRYTGPISDTVAPSPVASPQDRITTLAYNGIHKASRRVEADGTTTLFRYDGAGNLVQETRFANTSAPRVLRYAYDRDNRLTLFTDADGTLTSFTYDGANNKTSETISSSTDPNAVRTTTYQYDLNNRLIRQAFDPAGLNIVQQTAYDRVGNVVAKTDGNGHVTRFVYDLNNRVTQQLDPLGNSTRFEYDRLGNRIRVVDARNNATDFVYDGNNRVTREIAPEVDVYTIDGGLRRLRPVTEHRYDAAGNEVQTVDANGAKTTRWYDSNNRLIAELNGDNVLRRYERNGAGEQVRDILFMTRLTDADHNPSRLPAAPAGESRVSDNEYDLAGRLTRVLLPEVELTTLSGTDSDNPTATRVRMRPVERHVFDAFGNEVESFDRNGNRTVSYYDVQGNKRAQVDALGYLTEWDYDAQGNVLEQRVYAQALDATTVTPGTRPTPPAGEVFVTSRRYDAASRLIEEKSPLVEVWDNGGFISAFERIVTRYTYDAVGNQLTKTSAAGSPQAVTEFHYYDANNRNVAIVNAGRVLHLFEYDAVGNQTLQKRFFNIVPADVNLATASVAELLARVGAHDADQAKRFDYDAMSRVTAETDLMGPSIADDLARTFRYDAKAQRTWLRDEDGFVTQTSYNALGATVRSVSPDGSGTTAEYDAAGNQIFVYTGQIQNTVSAPVLQAVTLGNDLTIRWNVAGSAMQSYVVFDTVSRATPDDYANRSTVQSVLLGASGEVRLPVTAPGQTLYFRIVAQDVAGNRAWTAERSVFIPPRFTDVAVAQPDATTLEVVTRFAGNVANPLLRYGQPQAANNTVAFIAQADGTWKATITGVTNAAELVFVIAWQDAAARSYQSAEIPFRAAAQHVHARTTVGIGTVVSGSTTRYRVNLGTTLPSAFVQSENLTVVAAQWRAVGSATGFASTAVSVTNAVVASGKHTFNLVLGQDVPLDAGDYEIILTAVTGDGREFLLDRFTQTVSDTAVTPTRDTLTWAAPAVGDDLWVVIDGVRVNATRSGDRAVASFAALAAGTHDYFVFYGDRAAAAHRTDVTSSPVTVMQGEPPAPVVTGYDLTVAATFDTAEVANIASGLRLAWRAAGSGASFANDVAVPLAAGSSNRFAVTLNNLAAGQYDLKLYYRDAAGREVLVDWLRANTAVASVSYTDRRSLTVAAREAGGTIAVDAQNVYTQTAGLYTGPLTQAGLLPALSLATDLTGSPAGTADADGRTQGYFTEFRYNALNHKIASNETDGLWREFGVDGNGNAVETRLHGTQGAPNPVTSFVAFDARNQKIAEFSAPRAVHGEANPRRAVRRYEYDALGNLVRDIGADGSVTRTVYNALKSRTQVIDALGGQQLFRYDRLGNDVAVVDQLGRIHRKFYDAASRLVEEQDASGRKTGYRYDAFDRKIAQTDGRGMVTPNPEDFTTLYAYDQRDRLTAVSLAQGWHLANDDAAIYQDERKRLGFTVTETDADGNETVRPKLAAELTAAEKQALIAKYQVGFTYDGRNNRTSTTDPNGHTTTQVFDALGRVIDTITQQNGTAIHERRAYDAYGNLISETDGEGRVKVHLYAGFGRLIEDIDEGGEREVREYDALGNLARQYNPEGSRDLRRFYDAAGNLVRLEDRARGVTTTYGYDIQGRKVLEATTGLGAHDRTYTYRYDAMGWRTRVAEANTGLHINYLWDAAGNLARAVTDLGYDPDAKNINLASVLTQAEADLRALTDAAGDPRYTGTQAQVIRARLIDLGVDTRRYDEVYRLEDIDDEGNEAWSVALTARPVLLREILTRLGYEAALAAATIDPNFRFLDHHYRYDAANRVSQLTRGLNGPIVWAYTYDEAGNRISWNEAGTITDYTYDAGNRVVEGRRQSGSHLEQTRWTYDSAGNILRFATLRNGSEVSSSEYQYFENNRNFRSVTAKQGEDTQTIDKTLDLSGRLTNQTLRQGSKTFYYAFAYAPDGRELRIQAWGDASGTSTSTYDVNGHRLRVDLGQGDGQNRPEFKTFVLDNDGRILQRFHDTGKGGELPTETAFFYSEQGHPLGETGTNTNGEQTTVLDTGKYNLIQNLGEDFPSTALTSYQVHAGDTLQSIAAALYGNPSLWFVLAEANGLRGSESLKEGTTLQIPAHNKIGRLTHETHRLYSEADIVGSTLPNLKSPPPPKKGGCGSFLAIIIIVVVAIVASFFIGPLATGILNATVAGGAAAAGSLATALAYAAAGLIVGAVASIVQQGLFIALGYQEKFSWRQVAAGAIAGAFAGAAQGVSVLAEAGKFSSLIQNTQHARIAAAALKVAGAASKQLIEAGKITSWSSLAVAALGSTRGTGIADPATGKVFELEGVLTQTTLNYVSPALELVETYVRNDGELTPANWASALGATLTGAVSGGEDSKLGQALFGDLGDEARRTLTNLVVAGALSHYDKDAAEDFLYNSLGNEVGQFIGQSIGEQIAPALQAFTAKQLFDSFVQNPGSVSDEFAAKLARTQGFEYDARLGALVTAEGNLIPLRASGAGGIFGAASLVTAFLPRATQPPIDANGSLTTLALEGSADQAVFGLFDDDKKKTSAEELAEKVRLGLKAAGASDEQIAQVIDQLNLGTLTNDIVAARDQFDSLRLSKSMFASAGEITRLPDTRTTLGEAINFAAPLLERLGDATLKAAEYIDNPIARYTLLAIDIASGPIKFAISEAIQRSPAGELIGNAIGLAFQETTAFVSEQTGLDQERAGKIVIGTLAVGGLALLGGKFLKRNLGDLATSFRNRVRFSRTEARIDVDLSKQEILGIGDARRLTSPNRGVIYVKEPRGGAGADFEAGVPGQIVDSVSGGKAVPALRFDNPEFAHNPKVNNFIKFDGVEADGRTLIDRKTSLTTYEKQIDTLRRASTALDQNPGYKLVYEFPDQKAAERARKILEDSGITNRNISVRVAK